MCSRATDRFGLLTECRLDVGWRPANWIRMFIGYDFLFVNGVVRAGSLINGVDSRLVPQLHPNGAPTAASYPSFRWGESGFWVQGLQTGVEIRY